MTVSSIIRYAVLVSLAVVLFQYQKIQTQNSIIEKNDQVMSALAEQVHSLKAADIESRELIEKLLNRQNEISQYQVKQQSEFKRLKNEVVEIKTWSDVVLPADLARLFKREARTGSGAYTPAVPGSNPMPVAPGKPDNQR
ncbi:MAG: hypothetical protein GX040_04395 [Alcaligenaceae bacterium]|nr:hypothetical protein [Alcaligenaceae bacterium]